MSIVGVGPVHLVEVDVVGVEPAQRVLDRRDDPAPRAAARFGSSPIGHEELRREHDVVATALDRLADDLLGLAGRVDVGGVDEVDPGVQRAVDDADRVVLVGVAPGAEHHRAEAELGDLDAGASERAVVPWSGLRDVDDRRPRGVMRLGLRPAAPAGVQGVDRCHLLGGELEVEDVEVLGDALRAWSTWGSRERPCCRRQRSMTWAGVLPCASAMLDDAGSVSVPV